MNSFNQFEIKYLGEVRNYLGIQVERDEDVSLLLHQSGKIVAMLQENDMQDCKAAVRSMETGCQAMPTNSKRLPNNKKCRQAIGSLLYIATISRLDIALAVGLLSRRVEQPTEADWASVKRVMRYLAATINRKLILYADEDLTLRCYVDADWAGDHQDRKSTSGYIFQEGKSLVAWASRKQTT